MREKYDWEEIYEGAVLETDDTKLPTRLHAARDASVIAPFQVPI
jgi:hypothetical protein